MYNLIDFPENKLKILSGMIRKEIGLIDQYVDKAKQYLPEGPTYNDVVRRDLNDRKELEEMYVWVQTALGMVQATTKTLSN